MAVGIFKVLKETEPAAILSGCEPVAWFLLSYPAFVVTLIQPPGPRRWLCLPLNLFGPAMCLYNVDKLYDGLDWLWSFTATIYIFHATSALYLEKWTLPSQHRLGGPSAGGSNISNFLQASYKLWNNPRRRTLQAPEKQNAVPLSQRAVFALKNLGIIAGLWALYLAQEIGTLLLVLPMPRDFLPAKATYHHFALDRQTLIRSVFALQWAWLTYLILTVANCVLAIVFVSVLRLDAPEEWPTLWGSPLEAYTLNRFWGVFWHKIGSPSQKSWGRLLSRQVFDMKPESAMEKVFLALWIYGVSGLTHVVVNWMTKESAPIEDIYGDVKFLFLNFMGGLLEFLVGRHLSKRAVDEKGDSKGRRQAITLTRKLMGFAWVFLFFYCVVPPWQYPYLYQSARKRLPQFTMNVQINR